MACGDIMLHRTSIWTSGILGKRLTWSPKRVCVQVASHDADLLAVAWVHMQEMSWHPINRASVHIPNTVVGAYPGT